MRVLVAFDKFKDALSAQEACAIVANELHALHPSWSIDCCPLADGGEGFARILTDAAGGTWHALRATGPRSDRTVLTGCGLVDGGAIPEQARSLLELSPEAKLGVVDLAGASGLVHLAAEERNVWFGTTVGTGEVIRAAQQSGAAAILLGIGGSATHDLGLGALSALGWTAWDLSGRHQTEVTPQAWASIQRWQAPDHSLPPICIACDVTSPLLGPRGAAALYAPQKGLAAEDFDRLEQATQRMAELLATCSDAPLALAAAPGAGAAGGTAFGFMAATGARLLSGFNLVAEWLEIESRLHQADIVITGEGRYDATSLEGKGPGAIALRAQVAGKRTFILAGAVTVPPLSHEIKAVAITPAGTPLTTALANTRPNLQQTVRQVFG